MSHSKWVYKTKRHAEDAERYKLRLVTCGNKQSFIKIFFKLNFPKFRLKPKKFSKKIGIFFFKKPFINHGVNYKMTFTAVMNMTTAKIVLALVRLWRVPTRQELFLTHT